ncbi:MAG: Holliday junction branch migration DNA helicase RuvB [Clostridiales bacterium]|jgi:Holliday junction DNA helicase RuvB|nr:Holliday junction branch migration DNA helicase RuvB [Clostridiales bacterium]
MDKRIIATGFQDSDKDFDVSLRPASFESYVGQERVKNNLKIYIEAAKMRNEPLDHVLLYGPPGLGKTTLANIIASEMRSDIKTTSGPAIERAGDIAVILNDISESDILFVDEIHRLNRAVEEVLYPVMEDFAFDIIIGKGAGAKSIRLELPKFTLIGATTRAGLLTAPLRDRFGVIMRLEPYDHEELAKIIRRSAGVLKVEADDEGVAEIARRSRGTPRVANRLLKRVRDFAQVKFKGAIDGRIARESLDLLEVDKMGLDLVDRKLLLSIIEKFGGGPVGLENIAVSIDEEPETIEDVYEPYLIQLGFVQRTSRGRIVTRTCYEYFGLNKRSD